MKDETRKFAENLIDDLYIAETLRERRAADTGKRLTLEEVERQLQEEGLLDDIPPDLPPPDERRPR